MVQQKVWQTKTQLSQREKLMSGQQGLFDLNE